MGKHIHQHELTPLLAPRFHQGKSPYYDMVGSSTGLISSIHPSCDMCVLFARPGWQHQTKLQEKIGKGGKSIASLAFLI